MLTKSGRAGKGDVMDATSHFADISVDHPYTTTWSTGLWDCVVDWRNAVDVFLCSRCVAAQQFNKIYTGEEGIHWPVCLLSVVLDFGAVPLGGIVLMIAVRQEIRSRYSIDIPEGDYSNNHSATPATLRQSTWVNAATSGTLLLDICAVLFCTPCALCQQHREMTVRGEWPSYCILGSNPQVAIVEAPEVVHIT